MTTRKKHKRVVTRTTLFVKTPTRDRINTFVHSKGFQSVDVLLNKVFDYLEKIDWPTEKQN